MYMLADDTITYYKGKMRKEVISLKDIQNVYDWLSKNKLCLNVGKTNCMVFGSKKTEVGG